MLTRLYIDNFRCFVNFEYKPARRNLIIGRNGSGKSSLLDAILFLRQFLIAGKPAEEFFASDQRTRWLDRPEQTFEIEALLDDNAYVYRLVTEQCGAPPRPRVALETLHLGGQPLFQFDKGDVHLYSDRFEHKVTYPFDPGRSALGTIDEREDTRKLTRFKRWFSSFYCFRLNPFAMGMQAEGENLYPNVNVSNVAAWYRHLMQDNPRENSALLESLRASIDDFNFLELEFSSKDIRLLVAEFDTKAGRSVKIGFSELSDGQRCLICLYIILHFVAARGGTVIIDEPENFISLAEIQPWLIQANEIVEECKGQVLLISHHPEVINQWAPSHGVQFVRDGFGAVHVEPFLGDPQSSLPPAELVARGWERG